MFCQYLSDGYCKPGRLSPCLSESPWSSPTDFPSDPCEGRPKWTFWEGPCSARELDFYFGFLPVPLPSHPRKAIGPGAISCGPVTIQRMGMQLESSHSSYLCNAFLLGLCGSKGVLPPHPLGSGMFTIVT